MLYNILDNGEIVNKIVSDEAFVAQYCLENDYTYEEDVRHDEQATTVPESDYISRLQALETSQTQQDELLNILVSGDTGEAE